MITVAYQDRNAIQVRIELSGTFATIEKVRGEPSFISSTSVTANDMQWVVRLAQWLDDMADKRGANLAAIEAVMLENVR